MGIGDTLEAIKELREVADAFNKLRHVIKEVRPGGVTAEEGVLVAKAFADLTNEVADLLAVGAENKEELLAMVKRHLVPA